MRFLIPLVGAALFARPLSAKDLPSECDDGFLHLKVVPEYCATHSRDFELAILPGVFAQKETSLGFAVYNEGTFYLDGSEDTFSSRVSASFAYTLNQQFLIRIQDRLNFKNNDHVIEGTLDFRLYPNRYYGIGNDSDWDYQVYSETVLGVFQDFRKRIKGPLYAGAVWDLRSVFKFDPREHVGEDGEVVTESDQDPLSVDDPAGAEANLNHGLGAVLVWDTRDDFDYPRNGGFYRTYVNYYGRYLGGNYDYVSWVLDARQYITTFGEQVLALQALSEMRHGEVPFTSLSEMGGPWQMRGYFRGRYRDKNMLLFQAEYRYPIYKRLSGVAFASIGEVYGEKPFKADLLRWTLGGGLRLKIGHRTYIRLDLAGNPETLAGVFNGGQAF